jgi:hypothetical protein
VIAIPRESRRELALVACALLLPIPLLAATGLGVPLPGTVERGLASLVPFLPPATDGRTAAAPGRAAAQGAGSSAFTREEAEATRRPEPPRITPSTVAPRSFPAPSGTGGGSGTFEDLPAPDAGGDPGADPTANDSPAPEAPTPSPAPDAGAPPVPTATAAADTGSSVDVDAGGVSVEADVDTPLDLPPVEAEIPLPDTPDLALPALPLPLP